MYGNGHFALDKRTGGLSQEAPVVAFLDLRALGAEPPTARASWPIVDLVLLIAPAPDVCLEATRLASDDAWAFPGVSKYLPTPPPPPHIHPPLPPHPIFFLRLVRDPSIWELFLRRVDERPAT